MITIRVSGLNSIPFHQPLQRPPIRGQLRTHGDGQTEFSSLLPAFAPYLQNEAKSLNTAFIPKSSSLSLTTAEYMFLDQNSMLIPYMLLIWGNYQ